MRTALKRDSCDSIFCRIASLTRMKEDLLTECFAATLQADPTAAKEYWRLITRNAPRLQRLRGEIRITTQHSAGERSARIDMRVTRAGRAIGVEHKLYAPEGMQQLPRYLALPKTDARHIAFVSADYRTVARDVINNRRYLQPSSRQHHFVWADFHPVVAKSAARGSTLAAATVALMDSMDLAPVHRIIGDVRVPSNDLKLLSLWQPLIKKLRKDDWIVNSSFGRNHKSEIWIEAGPSKHLDVVRLDPFSSPSSLVVRLKANSKRKRDYLQAQLLRHLKEVPCGTTLGILPFRVPPTSGGFDWVLEVKVAWLPLLKRCARSNVPLTK